jgi:SH3-like domain-containing protein
VLTLGVDGSGGGLGIVGGVRGRITGLIAMLAVLASHTGALGGARWQGPGWYMVTAKATGVMIRDGRFESSEACRTALGHDRALAKHSEYDADTCVNLTEDIEGRPWAATTSVPSPDMPGSTPAPPHDPLPRFASLTVGGVQVRRGPSDEAPVRWIYLRKGWPVEIISENAAWRQIQDMGGDTGWVRANLLGSARMAILTGTARQAVREKPEHNAPPLAWASADALIAIAHCDFLWCAVKDGDVSGYMERSALWGLLPGE